MIGSNAAKRSPTVDPQSPYYTRLYSNHPFNSHTEREEISLDKKRNTGRTRSSNIQQLHSGDSFPN